MAGDLISKRTRQLVREYFSGIVLREIGDVFEAADIEADLDYDPPQSGQRRCFVEQHYHTLDFSNMDDVRRFLKVCEHVLEELDVAAGHAHKQYADDAKGEKEKLLSVLKEDGFIYAHGHLVRAKPALGAVTERFDHPELHRQIERMYTATDDDPGLAIGTAKEMIETTCKTILRERGVAFSKDDTVPELVKATRKALQLLPEDIPDEAKGADTIRRLLANLGSLGQSVAELRNLYGTGHGRDGRHRGVPPRVARMAAGAASTLCTFLLETHEERPG